MKRLFITLGIIIAILPLYPKDIVVSSLLDNGNGSLREAINSAENGDEIFFEINNTSNILIIEEVLTIKKSLLINGINRHNGDTITIKQHGEDSRILSIEGVGNKVYLHNLKLTEGTKGCIYLDKGNELALSYCQVFSNYSYHEYPFTFGGIYADENSKLVIDNCKMHNNVGNYGACSLYALNATVEIKKSSFSRDNTSGLYASISVSGGSLKIEDSYIQDNTLGVQFSGDDFIMRRCIVKNNSHTGNASGGGCV